MHHDWNPLDLNDIVADEFVCPSHAHAEHVSLMASRPVKTVHHGIPIEEYPFKEEKKDYLLFLGRMSPYKGADRAVEIAKEVGEELIVAGMDENVESQDYVFKVMKKANEYGFSYLGKVSLEKKLELLADAKAVLLPYRREYMGVFEIIFVEAMACMTPVITTRLGSAEEEVIKDGETGFLVERDFQSAIGRLDEIENEQCRKRAKAFKLKRMIDQLKEVLMYDGTTCSSC
nr:glycosyltransferase [uncultured bacterium]